MRSLLARTLLPCIFLSCLPVSSQARTVCVGVLPLSNAANALSANDTRDRLIRDLNHRVDKRRGLKVVAIPLRAESSSALSEAKEKSCEFILSTDLTQSFASSTLTNNGPAGMDPVPVFHAALQYRLIRVADGAGFAVGSVNKEDSSSKETAVWSALTGVARQAIADIAKGGNLPLLESASAQLPSNALSGQPDMIPFAARPCRGLPDDIPHVEALRGICEFAANLPGKMPNFVCDQETSRYQGNSKVPFDLITALVRYEDGRDSYSEIKRNGKPAPQAITSSPGLWSSGQFGTDLLSIFVPANRAVFEFAGENTVGDRQAWVFTYRIAKQNDPLWRLHGEGDMLAPPYRGELWIDQKTREPLRFGSVATDIPPGFSMASAELRIDYVDVAFADGSLFVLPSDFTVIAAYRRGQATRNVVRFTNCHRFRAKARITDLTPKPQ